MKNRLSNVAVSLICLTALCACSRSQLTTFHVAAAGDTSSPAVARLDLSYSKPAIVGSMVHATATGLPPGKMVDLNWETVTGGWVVQNYYQFRGKKFSDTTTKLGEFAVDANGTLDATFKIPEDYGGVHDIIAAINGKPVAQNGIEVTQTFELTPTSGPVGTPIELKVKGLGWRTMESTWVVNWDNHNVGWVSAVGTRGSAVAHFRAAGPMGDHVIKVYTGYQGQSYLNYEQSPVAHLPRPQFTFKTTSGEVVRESYAEPYQKQPVPATELKLSGEKLTITPTQGPVGSHAVLRGEGLPKNTAIQLMWQTYVGSRVSGLGFEPQEKSIGQIPVGSDGRFQTDVTIPEDLGGLHGLALRYGDNVVGRAFYVIQTSIVSITPKSGPVGTPVTIHLKGVGWTEYDNIYTATYDNAYMGYVCGFNSQGDVVFHFAASGEPGPHIIDMYPGIYQGPATEPQQLYRTPQLTYADDHPGNKIPALHFTFEVMPSSSSEATKTASLTR